MRDLFGTISTRYLIAILNLALIFINAKALGVEGVGLVGLILAAIGIATMFCGILAGLFHEPLFHASRVFAFLLLDTGRSGYCLRLHGHSRTASRRVCP
jgi:hypothetical protein